MKYKFKRVEEHGYIITEEGHTMFPEDVIRRFDRLNFFESERSAMCELWHNVLFVARCFTGISGD